MGKTKPIYLLAGGRSANPGVNELLLREVFRESGRKSPSVGYVGTASADGEAFFNRLAAMFMENGAGEVKHARLAGGHADIPRAKTTLDRSDMICIGGGDVSMGIEILEEKEMVPFLAELYQTGKPFFGLSAGSIMLAKAWVRWRDPDDDMTAEVFPCLRLAPVFCDTHDEAGGWEELKTLLMLGKEGSTGYGIATGTALKVFPDGGIEARGGAVYRYLRQYGDVEKISDVLPLTHPISPPHPPAVNPHRPPQ